MKIEELIKQLINLAPGEDIKLSFTEKQAAYFVTTLGRVFSIAPSERVTQVNKFRRVYIRTTNGAKTIHRLVGKAFIENPENKPEINHIDGNPSNNGVSNLEWATKQENEDHAYRTGLKAPPQKNHNAKWTEEQCKSVMLLVKDGWTYKQAGATIGMPYSTVAHLFRRSRRYYSDTDTIAGEVKRGMGWRKGVKGAHKENYQR